jgi:serine-type D-Ala-D-Ala endopeptidase (penicillin-binding protein 7)
MRKRHQTPPYLLPAMFIFAVLFSVSVYVAQKIESQATVILAPALAPVLTTPVLSAPQFLVFDLSTGDIIVSREPDTVVPIASVTKLFAAANLVATYDLQATTTITWSDVMGDGGAGKLAYGQTYSYRDLLFPLLIESSNDAALVLERVTEGTLVALMNEWASTTGAGRTKFVDASGINDANVSTASDLRLLLSTTFSSRHHIFDITTLPQYIGMHTGWLNNNPIAGEVGYRGGKNGYTVAANRTLVVAVFDETINGNSYTLGYIVLGSDDLKADFDILRDFINNSAGSR